METVSQGLSYIGLVRNRDIAYIINMGLIKDMTLKKAPKEAKWANMFIRLDAESNEALSKISVVTGRSKADVVREMLKRLVKTIEEPK